MTPILTAIAPARSPIPTNEYQDSVEAIASHFWQFSAMSGDFPDRVGTLDLSPRNTNNIGRGYPGPLIGAPYTPAIRTGTDQSNVNNGGWLEGQNLGTFDEDQTTGAMGGFYKLGDATGVDTGWNDGFIAFAVEYSTSVGNLSQSLLVLIRADGNVWVVAQVASSTGYARWRTTTQPFADGEWHFLCVSQPADGTGVHIWIDGVEETVTETLQNGFQVTPTSDYWCANVHDDGFGAPNNRPVTAVFIGGRNTANDFDRIGMTAVSGVFWISGASLTQAQVDDLLDASNFLQQGVLPATSYEEYVYRLFGTAGPNVWPIQWRTAPGSALYNNAPYTKTSGNLRVTFPSGADQNLAAPAGLPGIKYGKPGHGIGTSGGLANITAGTTSWNVNETWTTGSWFIICRVPSGTGINRVVQYQRGSGGPSRIFDFLGIGFTGTSRNILVDCWVGNTFGTVNNDGDGWQLNTTNITSPWIAGDLISLGLVQPADGSGPQLYVNGEVPSNLNFQYTGSSSTSNDDLWRSGLNTNQLIVGRGDYANAFNEEIWDWIETDQVLTAQEIKNLHDIAFGNILTAA